MNEDVFRKTEKTLEPFRRIEKMNEQFRNIKEVNRRLSKIAEPFERLNKFHLKNPIFNSNLEKQLKKTDELRRGIERTFEEMPKSLLLLAEYGWYLDFETEFTLSIHLGNKIKNKDSKGVDEYLTAYYEDNFDKIIARLSKEHPDRAEILKQISAAHSMGHYFVSIPSIFTQIDGVCHDFTTKKFFIKIKKPGKNQYLPEIANEITNVSNTVLEAFLSPIYNQTPIIAHESLRASFPVTLNRHSIIHGVDKEYGTKLNSLKCISLLTYISDVLTRSNGNN